MNHIEAVIFDWSGTTVDFGHRAPMQAWVDAFADFGIDVTNAQLRVPRGAPEREAIHTLLAMPNMAEAFRQHHGHAATEADVDAIHARWTQKQMKAVAEHADIKPYVLQTVKSLREEDIKVGSTSDEHRALMEVLVARAAEQGYVPDCWFCAEDTEGLGCPYPYMLFAVMQKLRIKDVANVIAVGDTAADIEAGRAAGVWTVGVVEGSAQMDLSQAQYAALDEAQKATLKEQVADAFWSYGADFVIDDISEVFEVIRLIETDLEEDLDD